MISAFDYKIPRTLKEACDLLWDYGDKARLIAGGTDLVIALRKGDLKPSCLIDVTNIPELRKIEEQNGMIFIGAAATHSEIASSSIIKKYGRILSDAVAEIGSPQIRNVGTIGGNIINASPAADTIPPLMVLDAVAQVTSREGEKEVPLYLLFKGPYGTNLKPYEILVNVSFKKLSSDIKTSFVRLARREAMAIARMSVAVILQREKGKRQIKEVRISLGSVTPTPQRITDVEAILRGKTPDEERLKIASRKISEVMIQHSGVRPTTSYKAPVVEALFMRGFRQALGKEG
ncbi:MAG TPA: xanthine dehydrogenase family protein subunit M [Thermodesulfobacteriota bacterium]|nr:xanthine dehydrogenase family protein subunit M [Thermodesulfobacteriota bacterium]